MKQAFYLFQKVIESIEKYWGAGSGLEFDPQITFYKNNMAAAMPS